MRNALVLALCLAGCAEARHPGPSAHSGLPARAETFVACSAVYAVLSGQAVMARRSDVALFWDRERKAAQLAALALTEPEVGGERAVYLVAEAKDRATSRVLGELARPEGEARLAERKERCERTRAERETLAEDGRRLLDRR